MKNCKNCGTEFQPKHETRGHEQLYCSIKCRTEAYKKRTNEKQIENIEEKTNTINSIGRQNDSFLQLRANSDSRMFDLLEKLGEAKTETVRYQLKFEALEKENQELKTKINQLEMELNSLEMEDDEDGENDMISGLMSNFKRDPVTTINFAGALINQLFKPNTDAKATTTA